MKTFTVTFNGFFTLDAENRDEAEKKASKKLKANKFDSFCMSVERL